MCVLDAMPFRGMHRGQRTTFRSHFSPATWVLGSRGLEAKLFLWPWVLLSAASNTSLKYSMADSESFKKSYFPYQKEHRKFYRSRGEAVFLTGVSPFLPSTALVSLLACACFHWVLALHSNGIVVSVLLGRMDITERKWLFSWAGFILRWDHLVGERQKEGRPGAALNCPWRVRLLPCQDHLFLRDSYAFLIFHVDEARWGCVSRIFMLVIFQLGWTAVTSNLAKQKTKHLYSKIGFHDFNSFPYGVLALLAYQVHTPSTKVLVTSVALRYLIPQLQLKVCAVCV